MLLVPYWVFLKVPPPDNPPICDILKKMGVIWP